ncbi:helix-turn-helix domain-containing protein [Nibribacter ruber]|uniref:Helix-turn-helix domain-containing protein n=1 Tax=Nibribacter ruber TaxID=2698458 RepID=A0A6P1P0Q9_9BACT|nr:helix-turn-helix transcriptional regulator [Nibribacter ruber]QHL87988.1 helix-turn-helix domain-containing protein [Nibribacter ruber]
MDGINTKIKAARKARGLTQEAVAEELGMTKGNLSRMEKGDVAFSPERIETLARLFGMTVEELATFETLEEKVNREDRHSALSEQLRNREAQIGRMQRETERFLLELLSQMVREDEAQGHPQPGHRLFELPGIGRLLNGENTTPDFALLEPYREHELFKAQAIFGRLHPSAKKK